MAKKRKWYRISISLAGKCRIGFAAAVLLIIGAALFVPYRWMDKLVEQGKFEQAQAEVQHVLENHFRPMEESATTPKVPPLMLGDDQSPSVQPGRWTKVRRQLRTGSEQVGPYVVVPADSGGGEAETITGQFLHDRPLTQWIVLESASGELPTAEPGMVEPEEKPTSPRLPGDAFVRQGIRKFVEYPAEHERFEFVVFDYSAFSGNDSQDRSKGFLDRLSGLFPQGKTARYLRAVRADKGCMAGGCHTSSVAEGIPSDKTSSSPRVFTEGQLVGVISVTLPPGQTSTTLLFNRIFIITAGILASIIAIVTFYLITQRFILQPVRSLREAADRVTVPEDQESAEASVSQTPSSVSGNGDTQAGVAESRRGEKQEKELWAEAMMITEKIKTGDEFERLASAFHEMLGRLKIAHDRLRETNRALDLQLGELQARNIALFESNKLKSEFLANVSHELRTPLNSILGFAQMVQEKSQDSEDGKIRRYATNILDSGNQLLTMINELLELAKVEAGKIQVHWELCSAAQIIEALLNLTQPRAEQKELIVNVHVGQELGLIETDGGKLQQILFNLLSNALEFTPQGGRVDISARPVEDDYVEFKVSDTGPGIAPEDRDKVFEKFRQIDASVTREHPGTGLGLAIVKELVTILGGSVIVGGEVGKGTTMTVLLPRRRG
jgi:signal transduction histidine kinase